MGDTNYWRPKGSDKEIPSVDDDDDDNDVCMIYNYIYPSIYISQIQNINIVKPQSVLLCIKLLLQKSIYFTRPI